jgi:hypothetical protein
MIFSVVAEGDFGLWFCNWSLRAGQENESVIMAKRSNEVPNSLV